jgi:hypothetical protein
MTALLRIPTGWTSSDWRPLLRSCELGWADQLTLAAPARGE